ncbi:MAG: acyl-CoA dehydrogenase family protein [Acidimicrobiia bacterium]|nr:acyl-CoA dehydrogenase family protein [Acidimicrobiia bacterium]
MSQIDVDDFAAEAGAWLAANGEPKLADDGASGEVVWGEGELDVAVFHNLSHGDESDLLHALRSWQQRKAERGYHAITWSPAYGGLGLTASHARAFRKLESGYVVPSSHESFSVTIGLIVPTIDLFGTPEQKERHIASFLRTDELCIQLFSEPGAGSDLANLSLRADRDGDEWVLNGQKVWTSGAQFAQWGECIARSDFDAPKHKGMTAFILPLDLDGITVRPIRQMSGGQSFNEVFFDDVRVPDDMRLGDIGAGWKVALTTLGFERDHSDSGGGATNRPGGSWAQVLGLARWLGVTDQPVIRQQLADLFVNKRVEAWAAKRSADLAKGGTPGPEGSIGKLIWTENMTRMSAVVSSLLGSRLAADSGEWGTYVWNDHVLGAPGYRIAGGSDEVQRNIIGERVLGLPGEPRVDKGIPFKDVPR